jgi:inward rectifier potassium channel
MRFWWQRPEQEIEVVGAPSIWHHDLYHAMLRAPWWIDFIVICTAFIVLNVFFTAAYAVTDGISNAQSASDLFFFSVQTMATIGYGVMYPESFASHVLVTCEAITGILFSAVTTGVVFTKFSAPKARIEFASRAVITLMDGVPTMMLRAANQRGNEIVEATVRLSILRTEQTKEGQRMYRVHDLKPTRDRQPAFSRTWLIMHHLTSGSPLFGATPQSMKDGEMELIVSIVGTDENSAQLLHARHRYPDSEIIWGARYADLLSDLPRGRLLLDMRKFHDTVPTPPTADFAYPKPESSPASAPSP